MNIGDEIYVHGYVDEIRKGCVIVKNKGGYFGTVQEEISEAIPPIDLREMNLWIPCSERLPEEKERVLVSTDMNEIQVMWHDDGYWYCDVAGLFYDDEVLAWMELPMAYEVKEE